MPQIPAKIKPAQGFSHFIHIALNVLLPLVTYILVRVDFVPLAIVLVFLSKWRMFAVRPRYWLANILANSVDIIVALGLIIFMASTTETWWQVFWVLAYSGWLIWLKPRTDALSVSAQAMVGQLLGLSALYLKFGDAPLAALVGLTWLITYISARHFLTSFDEPYTALLAQVWAYFSASLVFILGHWLLFYGLVAQVTLLLTTIGYGLATLYYLDAADRLTGNLRRQLFGIMGAILLIVIALSDWSGHTV